MKGGGVVISLLMQEITCSNLKPTDRVFCQVEYSTVKFITVYIHLVSLNKQIKEKTLTDHVIFMGKLRNAYKILTMKPEK